MLTPRYLSDQGVAADDDSAGLAVAGEPLRSRSKARADR